MTSMSSTECYCKPPRSNRLTDGRYCGVRGSESVSAECKFSLDDISECDISLLSISIASIYNAPNHVK